MAIVSIPTHAQTRTIFCAICSQPISLDEATAGVYDPGGQQMFACNKHVWNRAEHLVGWADFVIAQRQAAPHRMYDVYDHDERDEYGERCLY